MFLSITSRSTTTGFVGGVDITGRNVAVQGDGAVFGLLTGFISTDLDVRSNQLSSIPANVPNGSSRLLARLSGPSVGLFSTYFNGPFSVDATLKFDIFGLDQNFTDQLAFNANIIGGALRPAVTVPFSGQASTGLVNTSVVSNVNYQIPLTETVWIEPTAGIRFVATNYDANAALLGLGDGHLLRVQGGARLGTAFQAAPAQALTATLTGLVFSDVIIQGGFIPGAGFGTADLLARSNEGKARGQGILALNYDFGNGVSAFVQGDVRGGQDLFGYGGTGGVRVQW